MNENEILRELVALSARLDSVEQKVAKPLTVMEPTPSDVHHHIHELDKARRAIEDKLKELTKRVPNLDDLVVVQQELAAIRKELLDCVHMRGKDPNQQFVNSLQPVLTMLSNLNKKVDVSLKQASKAADQASSAVKVHCRIAAETLEHIATVYAQE